jgi:hypothetical protein
MSTEKAAGFVHWKAQEIGDLVASFELAFGRIPSSHDSRTFRRTRSAAVRLPLQTRRNIATKIDDSAPAAGRQRDEGLARTSGGRADVEAPTSSDTRIEPRR